MTSFFSCDSAGTANYHIGKLADYRMRAIANNHSIELTHKARQFTKSDFDNFDYIIAMDSTNLQNIKALANGDSSKLDKIFLMREFSGEDTVQAVPDPYYDDLPKFEGVYQILKKANDGFLKYLLKNHNIVQ